MDKAQAAWDKLFAPTAPPPAPADNAAPTTAAVNEATTTADLGQTRTLHMVSEGVYYNPVTGDYVYTDT